MPHSDRLAELASLAAIGALDGADREEFESHRAAGCPDCERIVQTWQRDLVPLAGAVAPMPPSPSLRGRFRAAIAAEPAARPARLPPRPVVWLAAAACLAFVIVATDDLARRRALDGAIRQNAQLENASLRTKEELARRDLRVRFLEDPDVQAILLTGLGPQPNARGKVIYSPRARRAIFVTATLAPLSPDRQYELWFLAAGKPIAAGTFDSSRAAPIVFQSSPVPEGTGAVEKFAVTIEPRGGVPQPTGPMVLVSG